MTKRKQADKITEVVATQPGFYGVHRAKGARFTLQDPAHFSSRWMVDARAVKSPPSAPAGEDAAASELREALGKDAEIAELRAQKEALERRLAEARNPTGGGDGEEERQDTEEVTDDAPAAKADAEQPTEATPAPATRRRRALNS